MKFTSILAAFLVVFALSACGQKTSEEKVQDQISKVHALTGDERNAAQTNAKQLFEKQFPQQRPDGTMMQTNGYFNECRPSDSNANGMVTCFGKVPVINGGFQDVKRYCGYTPGLVGCSDEDTVK